MKNIEKVCLSELMPLNFIEYARDVIEDRALPDVRDGLKPVHRRILYAMNELKLSPEKGYRKCARVVGDVLGKYHPHGDSSVYGALVRMAQDFSLRYPLVDGHGNFGSIDGDSPASMRYTETRQSKISLEMVRDINRDTVDFKLNFDGEEKEPKILTSRFPNLLVNGSSGIAVGMATDMPPHNLNEVIDGVLYQIDNADCTIKDLMQYIKAPDFPTGANIINTEDLEKIYTNGIGRIKMRSSYHIETIQDKSKEKQCIVFTDVPYQVNKAKLVEDISEKIVDTKKIVKGKEKLEKAKIPNLISDVRDESGREGIRVVIELKKKGTAEEVLPLLFKHTKLQCNFGVNNVALVNGKPVKNISLKDLIKYYIEHQQGIIRRRTAFDKQNSQKSLHIAQGLQKAIDKLDFTIQLIRESKNKQEAKELLIKELEISEAQSDSILQMQLQRLTNLEKDNIIKQVNDLELKIEKLNEILDDKDKLNEVLKSELIDIKEQYGDERRTKLLYNVQEISAMDIIPDGNFKLTYTKQGYIKKLLKYSDTQKLKEDDEVVETIDTTNKSTLLLFTNKANRYKLQVHKLEETVPSKIGDFIPNLIDLEEDEYVIKIVSPIEDKGHIISLYENGNIVKVPVEKFMSANQKIVNCYNIDSKLMDIFYSKDNSNAMFITNQGKALIIETKDLRPISTRNSAGVVGIKLEEEDGIKPCVIGAFQVNKLTKFEIETNKKLIPYMLDDIATSGNKNEERKLHTYLFGRRGNKGSFIYNCRVKKDEIKSVTIIK